MISCCFICNFPQIFEVEHVFIFFISFLYFILFFWRAVYLDIFPIFNWVVCLLTVFVFCFGGVFLASQHVGSSCPDQGSNQCSEQWKCGVLTSGSSWKSLFLLLSFNSSLDILNTSHLSRRCFARIFWCSVTCLFILLTLSFSEEMFFILMKWNYTFFLLQTLCCCYIWKFITQPKRTYISFYDIFQEFITFAFYA